MSKIHILIIIISFNSCSNISTPEYILTNQSIKLVYKIKTIHSLNYKDDIRSFVENDNIPKVNINTVEFSYTNMELDPRDSLMCLEYLDTLFVQKIYYPNSDTVVYEYNTKLIPLHDWRLVSKITYTNEFYLSEANEERYIFFISPTFRKNWFNNLPYGRIEQSETVNLDTLVSINKNNLECIKITSIIFPDKYNKGLISKKYITKQYGIIFYKNYLGEEIKLINILHGKSID